MGNNEATNHFFNWVFSKWYYWLVFLGWELIEFIFQAYNSPYEFDLFYFVGTFIGIFVFVTFVLFGMFFLFYRLGLKEGRKKR